ncbi:mismatch repair protein MLH2 [Nakaseomyces bracarensis]|uniref:mismatch repair protein MLH2 n=1 Tax=Nakaseomyces bracarensis TaxID=273131 RepID=UPI003871EA97
MAIHEIDADSKWKILSSSFIIGPMAAVKELIDNSVDGNAKNIYISIDAKTGGCDYISVRDDGDGVATIDRELMCLNHTTSKITNISDLSSVSTLGFRGEALFLLANLSCEVGRMEIKTKCSDEKLGERWFLNRNGSIKEETKKKVPCPTGTTVTIWNLLGGLKSRYIENSKRARKIIDEFKLLLSHYVLNFETIRFSLELVALNKNGSVASSQLQHSIASRLTKVRTLSLINKLRKPISVNFVQFTDLEITDNIKLEIILPTMSPESDVVNIKHKMKFLSVNNRALSKNLAFGKVFDKMINSIYKELQLFEPNIWYVNIKCATQLVDVNIEPEKNDILFNDEAATLNKMKEIIEMFLRETLNINPENSAVNAPSLHEMRLDSQAEDQSPMIITILDDEAKPEERADSDLHKSEADKLENHNNTAVDNNIPLGKGTKFSFEDQADVTLLCDGTNEELVQLFEKEEKLIGLESNYDTITVNTTSNTSSVPSSNTRSVQRDRPDYSQELHVEGDFIDDMEDYESTQDRNTQDRNTQDRNTQDRNTQDRNTQDRNTQDRNTQDRNTQDRNTQDGSTLLRNRHERIAKNISTESLTPDREYEPYLQPSTRKICSETPASQESKLLPISGHIKRAPLSKSLLDSPIKKRNNRRTIAMFSEYTNNLATRCTYHFTRSPLEDDQQAIDVWATTKANKFEVIVTETPEGWRKLTK